MGIRGLTTFIQNRSHLCFEDCELHDTNVVLDGNSIAAQLYKWHCKSNDCFGGDYDKYANVVLNFFQLLANCNVTPYVIFDGGYESRKITTIISRMRNKIQSAQQLDSVREGCISVFPLMLRFVFSDIAAKLNIRCVQCDFEGDSETASIGRRLNCPVLSYDSDYFIFDVIYIPFNTFDLNLRRKVNKQTNEQYNYISCQVYKVEKFLNSFGGLPRSNLPILAVLLGNDYIKKGVFSLFYQHMKIQKSRSNENEHQRTIKSVIIWLQNETIQSAITKVLGRYKIDKRKIVAEKINEAIKGYNLSNSIYLKYLDIEPKDELNQNVNNISNMVSNISESISEDVVEEVSSEELSEDELHNINDNDAYKNIPEFFLDNYRKGLYPPCCIDIFTLNTYYCTPQMENFSYQNCHLISFHIISAMHKILTFPRTKTLTCIGRNENNDIKKYTLPLFEGSVPTLLQIQTMDLDSRRKSFLETLKISPDFVDNCLNLFPPYWHLYLVTLKYFVASKIIEDKVYVYALILCGIILNSVDNTVGFYRSTKMFQTKFHTKLQYLMQNKDSDTSQVQQAQTILEGFENINYVDSLFCLKDLIDFFQMDLKMKSNSRYFDRRIIHSLAQFQSCILHIKYLNYLYSCPFQNVIVSDFYDGTFLYNCVSNFRKRSVLDDYMKSFLKNCPSVLNCFELATSNLKNHVINSSDSNKINVATSTKKRKHKRKSTDEVVTEPVKDSSDDDGKVDPNNKYSLLRSLNN